MFSSSLISATTVGVARRGLPWLRGLRTGGHGGPPLQLSLIVC